MTARWAHRYPLPGDVFESESSNGGLVRQRVVTRLSPNGRSFRVHFVERRIRYTVTRIEPERFVSMSHWRVWAKGAVHLDKSHDWRKGDGNQGPEEGPVGG